MAEYLAMPAKSLYRIPDWVGYEAAALCEPLTVALYAVQDISSLTAGQVAVVLGPGPIGLATIIAAGLFTPRTIIATGTTVDINPRLQTAKKLGADVIINVDEEDPVKKVLDLTRGMGADVVYEAAGVPLLRQGLAMLRYGGEYIAIGHPGSLKPEPIAFDSGDYYRMQSKRQKILTCFLEEARNWQTATDMLWKKRIDLQPLVSHVLPLSDAVKGFEIASTRKALKVVLVP
jgi:threonine dehydrogenase-like Zn-dependent dehydrogenase